MANTKVKKTDKSKKKRGFLRRIGHFFKEVVSELKKVTWPTKRTVVSYTIAVVVFVIIMMVIVFFLDQGATKVFDLIGKIQ
ncbi:MAG: preprotein translocase subunit SecE [Eubacteriales bacterium]